MMLRNIKYALYTMISVLMLTGNIAKAAITDSSIIVDGRIEDLTQMYNDDAGSPIGARPTNSTIMVKYFRADFQGKIGEDTAYRFRMNFPNSATAVGYPGSADNISKFFDYAYISRKLMTDLKLVAGKQRTDIGGWVGFADPLDVYMYPVAFLDYVGFGLVYSTQIALQYEFAGQKVDIAVVDPGSSSAQATTTAPGGATNLPNNGRQIMSARYMGNFLDKSVQPYVAYMTETIQNVAPSPADKKYQFLTLGLKYTIPVLDIEADYLSNNMQDKTTAGQTDTTNSLYILARYKMEDLGLKPFVAYENSNQNVNNSATADQVLKTSAFQVGLEYYPKSDENFRYHIVYTNSNVDNNSGVAGASSTKQAQQQIIAGMRFKAEMLK